jgi:hypothetical protein
VPALFSEELLPWDSQGPIYAVALLLIGLLLGFLGPGELIAAISGLLLGQLFVLLGRVLTYPATRDLWLVSTMLLAGYTFVAAGLGAIVGSALRRRFGHIPRAGERRSS